jgi:hypothetical protein
VQRLDTPQNALVANAAATAAVTNLVGATLNMPAGRFAVGQVWRLRAHFTYLHAAATTPTLTVELAVAGTAIVAAVVTPVATATTFHGVIEGYFTVRTLGAAGTVMGSVHCTSHGLTLANAGSDVAQVDTTADTIDTTIAWLVELRVRMTTAVASNTLTLSQGWCEKVVG